MAKSNKVAVKNIVKLLKVEDINGLVEALDDMKSSYAVKYVLQALTESGHGWTVPALAEALKTKHAKG